MQPHNHYYGIDLIRFLAAASVLCFHFLYLNDAAGGFRAAFPVAWFGWIGVEVFFVISGLVIANSASGSTALQFLRGRFLRLYPAAWICATIALAVGLLAHSQGLLPRYFRSMILFPNGPWMDTVYWTLGVEMGFYAMVLALLACGVFTSINVFAAALTTVSTIFILFIGSVLVGVVPESGLSHFAVVHEHALDVILLARHGAFFALGIWLWLSTSRPLMRWEMVCAVLAAVICIIEILLRSREFMPMNYPVSAALAPAVLWTALVSFLYANSRHVGRFSSQTAKILSMLGTHDLPALFDPQLTRSVRTICSYRERLVEMVRLCISSYFFAPR